MRGNANVFQIICWSSDGREEKRGNEVAVVAVTHWESFEEFSKEVVDRFGGRLESVEVFG